MPNKKFLESHSLYQKFEINLPKEADTIPMPSINLYCKNCGSVQTFILSDKRNRYGEIFQYNSLSKQAREYPTEQSIIHHSSGEILNVTYRCVACGKTSQHYSIKISEDLDYVIKVGQFPPLDKSVEKNLKKILGKHEETYNKGLTCESFGYGIGAYAYYRRIIEEIIDELLKQITEIVEDENKDVYEIKLTQLKEYSRAKDKIALVKGLLPNSLNRNGINPLQSLYSVLSEGIHKLNDNECLEIAKHIHWILTFLVREINQHKEDNKMLNDNIKKMLKK